MRFLILALLLLVSGCGGGEFALVPVSGVITMDDKPLEGAEVVFAPQQIKGQASVGPASIGVTDSSGRFVLKTATGQLGAVVAAHTVAVKMNKLNEGHISAMADQAFEDNKNISSAELREVRKKAREEMMSKTPIPESYNRKSVLTFSVKAATESANFDLRSDGS